LLIIFLITSVLSFAGAHENFQYRTDLLSASSDRRVVDKQIVSFGRNVPRWRHEITKKTEATFKVDPQLKRPELIRAQGL
jgi:hypothetical protein